MAVRETTTVLPKSLLRKRPSTLRLDVIFHPSFAYQGARFEPAPAPKVWNCSSCFSTVIPDNGMESAESYDYATQLSFSLANNAYSAA
jgi:hypothetical protein